MPKQITMKMYKCEYCGKMFDRLNKCASHELFEHKCPTCVHSYYVYGCELQCSRKSCKYQNKE